MKKTIFGIIAMVISVSVFVSCGEDNGKDEVKVNPLKGVWTVDKLTIGDQDMKAALAQFGVDCVGNAQISFTDDTNVSFSMCDYIQNGTYTYNDTDSTLSVSVKAAESTKTNTISGSFSSTQLSFVLADVLKSVDDLKKVVNDQLAAKGIELNTQQQVMLNIILDKLVEMEGEATFKK